MTSPLRWAGGKRKIWPQIRAYFPQNIVSYAEPFLGGASVYLALADEGYFTTPCWVALSDALAPLVQFWTDVRDRPRWIIDGFQEFAASHGRDPAETYQVVREIWNDGGAGDPAAFLYLNRAGFNGLWRENAKGGYNVPRGDRVEVSLGEGDVDNLLAVSAELQRAKLLVLDFRAACARATRSGALIYADPPYDETFVGYTSGSFTRDDRADLVWHLRQHVNAGHDFIANDADTSYVRELYQGFNIAQVTQRVSVNSDGKGRGAVADLVITNREVSR